MVYHGHELPCLHCQPQTYIRMVQQLIERCLLFRMNREDCITTLEKHASILPLITLTVWEELLKENRDFFEAYFHAISPSHFSSRPEESELNFKRRKLRIYS